MDNLSPVWNGEKLYIGTEATSATPPVWTYAQLCKGIKNITSTPNEQNQQAFYMCGQGGANNEVTGIALEYDVTGDRVEGDAAQDYIAGLRYKLGKHRKSSMKLELYNDGTLVETIIADCTITDIVVDGGDATGLKPFSCKIRVNGIPTVTPAST